MKIGAVRSDGYIFKQYRRRGRKRDGARTGEVWMSPTVYHRARIGQAFVNSRKRALAKTLPFDIDLDYLVSIFPCDGRCPALNIPMVWGGGDDRDNSPSLDRKTPDLGYVRGNVAFISNKANRIKSNATNEEVLAVAKYLQG